MEAIIVLTTYPDTGSAKKAARALLEQQLAACVNLLPEMTSFYHWQGDIESSREYQLVIKTRRSLFTAVRDHILAHHPYEVPEIVSIDVSQGSDRYLDWIKETTHA